MRQMNVASFRIGIILSIGAVCFALPSTTFAAAKAREEIHGVYAGMPEADFAKIYPQKKARTYRKDQNETWITFNEPLEGKPLKTLTFHLKDKRIAEWGINERIEVINEYLGEFCSGAFLQETSKFYIAIKDVLRRMPLEAFLKVTDRRSPVLFTEVYDSGTAQFASSAEIIAGDDDPPAFQNGMTILKLSTALDGAETLAAIKGIVAHELAHKFLDHVRKGNVSCDSERETNRLIKRWGFEKEYEAASKMFGREKVGGAMSCQEKEGR